MEFKRSRIPVPESLGFQWARPFDDEGLDKPEEEEDFKFDDPEEELKIQRVKQFDKGSLIPRRRHSFSYQGPEGSFLNDLTNNESHDRAMDFAYNSYPPQQPAGRERSAVRSRSHERGRSEVRRHRHDGVWHIPMAPKKTKFNKDLSHINYKTQTLNSEDDWFMTNLLAAAAGSKVKTLGDIQTKKVIGVYDMDDDDDEEENFFYYKPPEDYRGKGPSSPASFSDPEKSPLRGKDKTKSPNKSMDRISPTRAMGGISPTRAMDRISPTRGIDRISPTRGMDRSPTREMDISPMRRTDRSPNRQRKSVQILEASTGGEKSGSKSGSTDRGRNSKKGDEPPPEKGYDDSGGFGGSGRGSGGFGGSGGGFGGGPPGGDKPPDKGKKDDKKKEEKKKREEREKKKEGKEKKKEEKEKKNHEEKDDKKKSKDQPLGGKKDPVKDRLRKEDMGLIQAAGGGKNGDGIPSKIPGPASAAGSKEGSAGTEPGSADQANILEIAPKKILQLTHKGDWAAVEQALRTLEKAIITSGDINAPLPLIGVVDESTGNTPLMYAIKENRIVIVERMLQLGADVNQKNKEKLGPIHMAAQHAREDMIKLLIVKRVDVNAAGGSTHQTPIHMVCHRPTGVATNMLRFLLASASKDCRMHLDSRGFIPLFVAVESGNRGACLELLAHGPGDQVRFRAKPTLDNALHLAVRRRDMDLVRILVDHGAAVDVQNAEGQTPLHLASAEGDENLIKYFYSIRANANVLDNQDRTPLHVAAEMGHTAIVELLADKFKLSVFERTKDGSTLMHIASLHGHPETAMALFRKGVPLHMPNKGGARSIHIAARYGHAAMISALLQKGEKVDAVTNDNYTALHIAVESGHPNVVETLLGHGGQVHIKGGAAKETPLHIAARVSGGDKCAQMLLKSGANPNLRMENGETPLHVSSRSGEIETVKLLLEDGADPMAKSGSGETPLHVATQCCRSQVVTELLSFASLIKTDGSTVKDFINIPNQEGETALHYAAKLTPLKSHFENEDKEIVKKLLERAADVETQTISTLETPFHYVAREGNEVVLDEMFQHLTPQEIQKSLNRQSSVGWSPLLLACAKGHRNVVKNLLDNHARVDVFDTEGRSALHLAAEMGFQEVCDMLLSHRAFINSKSRVGLTALHLAAMKGYTELTRFLVQDHNAIIDALNLKKQTPLHLAAAEGQIEVCKLLMELGANIDAADESGQKPVHLSAENNHSNVTQLFLKHQPLLVTSATKAGNTCAHIAAMRGSVAVVKELMKFDKQGVISARNRLNDATPLQLAAEGGHAEVVKTLLAAGASPTDENKGGYTAVHLAGKHGHNSVLEVLKDEQILKIASKKLGLAPLHVAAFFGQTDTVRELLTHVSATVKSDAPMSSAMSTSFLKDLGADSGLTPLHLAAFSGNENVVRLLLNSQGVQVEAPTNLYGSNPLHLACRGGHITVVSLMLSRAADLLESRDSAGKTGLHIAATHGHRHMVEVLLGQGADISAADKEGWTPLHCAAKEGHLEVVRLLMESGASSLSQTLQGKTPIWFATAEAHLRVIAFLLRREHDTYGLMEDKEFVFNLTICGKNIDNAPLDEFILLSPAPVDIAAKLSNLLVAISTKEKERAKDLIVASKHCEAMTTELLSLAAGAESAGKVLQAIDRRSIEFLDVLIENEQKEVIAHSAVQRYLQEVWVGNLAWQSWKLMLLFLSMVICPPVWIAFSLPLGHKYKEIPIMKFMTYLTSHIYLMILYIITGVVPIYSHRTGLIPEWYEWLLLAFLSGLLLSELTNPSDKGGLGWIKVAVLIVSALAVGIHTLGFFLFSDKDSLPSLLYLRNQSIALAMLFACVQILDFLSFHYLFGPWAIIIGNLMKDLARFLAVLAIFMFGFSMVMAAMNQPFQDFKLANNTAGLVASAVTPINTFELLFFAMFGMTTQETIKVQKFQPNWTLILFKIMFGVYMLVTVIVLINLLIAMMSDTYQRIQAQSDIEWKFGLAKLIRNMHRTSATPSPINLFTSWIGILCKFCKGRKKSNLFKTEYRMSMKQTQAMVFGAGAAKGQASGMKWMKKLRSQGGVVAPKGRVPDVMRLSMMHANPLGSQISFGAQQKIETVADWPTISRKYRVLVSLEEWMADDPMVADPPGTASFRRE